MEAREAIKALNQTRDWVYFSLGAYALLTQEPSSQQILQYSVELLNSEVNVERKGEEELPPVGLSYSISFNELLSNDSCKEVVEISIYSMVSKSFEVIKEFIKENDIKLKDEDNDWFQFARHVRNAFSHNFKWDFRGKVLKDLKVKPVHWRNMEITADLNNQEIGSFLGYFDALQLNSTMSGFLQKYVSEEKTPSEAKGAIKKVIRYR